MITSASTPAALGVARILASQGHTVIALDKECTWGISSARCSRAYSRVYLTGSPETLATFWKQVSDEIDLWIPFGKFPQDIEEPSRSFKTCHASLFEKDEIFQDFARERILDRKSVTTVPLAFEITEHREVNSILAAYSDRTFSLSLTPYEDDCATLVDSSSESSSMHSGVGKDVMPSTRPTLPPDRRSYRLTEVISGGMHYSAHCLIADGKIRTFIVTTPEPTLHKSDFIVVPPREPLFTVFFKFTRDFVAAYAAHELEKGVQERPSLTTHLTIDFNVQEKAQPGRLARRIIALSCSSVPHPSILLLLGSKSNQMRIAQAYTAPSTLDDLIIFPGDIPILRGLYSFPIVLVEGTRTLRGLRRRWKTKRYWLGIANFVMMCFVWGLWFKEEMWCWWDPAPAFVDWFIRRPVEWICSTAINFS